MAKTVTLTTWERLQLIQTLPGKTPPAKLGQVIRLADVLELDEAEQAQVGMKINQESGAITWNDRGHVFEVTIEEADFEALIGFVKARTEWPSMPRTLAKLSADLLGKLADLSGKDLGV